MASTWVLARSEGEGVTKLFPGTLSNERMLAHGPNGRNRAPQRRPLLRGRCCDSKRTAEGNSTVFDHDDVVYPVHLWRMPENNPVPARA